MMVVTVLWLRAVGRMSAKLAVFFMPVLAFTIVLTSSNTGLIATSMGVLIFLLWTFQPGLLVKVLLLAAAAAVFFSFGGLDYLPMAFQKRVLAALVSGEINEAGTFVSRKALMWESLEMIQARGFNFIGIGADQFRVQSVQGIPVHNAFLILW